MNKETRFLLIKDIRRRQPDGVDGDQWLSDEMDRVADLRSRIVRSHQDELDARQLLEDTLKDIRSRRNALHAECPHIWEHFGDPAGGSDSFDECRLCGKYDR